MIKIDLGKCCMNCDHPTIMVGNLARGLTELDTPGKIEYVRDTRVWCSQQRHCTKYLEEHITALPAEEILND